jgi:hypothetical protein
LLKAFAAENWAPLRRFKRDGGFLTALGAGGASLRLVEGLLPGLARDSEHSDPFRLANLATLGLVLELLVMKKQLLAGGEYKVGTAVNTLQDLVLEFHLRDAPFTPFSRRA